LSVDINFIDGAIVNVTGDPNKDYTVKFFDGNDVCHYTTTIKSNWWAKVNRQYYTKWRVKIWENYSLKYNYTLDYKDKRVLISIESSSLGDNLAWIPYVEEFRKKHGCHVICSCFKTELFKESYPDIEFINPGTVVNNISGLYRIGIYNTHLGEVDYNKHPEDHKKIPLQKVAADILGIDYQEIIPKLSLPERKVKRKIGVAIHSTAQAKYWNNPTGWQDVVTYFKLRDYQVVLLSSEDGGYMGNHHPIGITPLPTGPLENVIKELRECEAFIGVGSGLSWLAWACEVPVFLISGFSESYTEMSLNTVRIVAPKGACSGCYNRHLFDKGNWNWCPDYKNTERQFECSRLITSKTVIDELEKYFNYGNVR
jgi:hypothetical protein